MNAFRRLLRVQSLASIKTPIKLRSELIEEDEVIRKALAVKEPRSHHMDYSVILSSLFTSSTIDATKDKEPQNKNKIASETFTLNFFDKYASKIIDNTSPTVLLDAACKSVVGSIGCILSRHTERLREGI